MKVIAIEEAHDVTTLSLDELFGSLLTFEILLADKVESKGKGVAFQSIQKDDSLEKGKAPCDQVNESIAMLTKQFCNQENQQFQQLRIT